MNYISSGGQIIPNLLGNPRANHQPGSKDTPFCRSSSKLLRCFPRTKLQRTKPLFIIIYHLVRACFIGNCPEKTELTCRSQTFAPSQNSQLQCKPDDAQPWDPRLSTAGFQKGVEKRVLPRKNSNFDQNKMKINHEITMI